MGPYETCALSSGDSSCGLSAGKISDIDGLLAGAGYRVRSSDLRHVAQRLERLESVIVNAPEMSQIVSDAVHYNPTDLASWVECMLSEINPALPGPGYSNLSDLRSVDDPMLDLQQQPSVMLDAWPPPCPDKDPSPSQQQQRTVVTATMEEEDSGIRLVHLLMTCAESMQRGEIQTAGTIIEEMRLLLTRVNTGSGIGKVAGYFIGALSRRLYASAPQPPVSAVENEILYHHFYEACPYLKFAHFTANQAILEAFYGHDCVHVIDFNLMHGLQWPALIQALALRPGGPPLLRLTGVGPPSPDGRDSLREIGLRLAELAQSVNVRFSFRGVAASRLDEVKPWMLQVGSREAVAINSVMQLHRLIGSSSEPAPIDSVLAWIRNLNPKIVTVGEQEADHNQPEFVDRFTEALYYYSTMFDSLEACPFQPEKAVAEMYIVKEISNVVCCEGPARMERHEPLVKWRARLVGAGFRPLHLGSNAFKQASMLLTLFSAQGYCVEENQGCLTLGWHGRPLVAASAWQAVP